jgi:DNA replication protein DnaC
MYKTIALAEMPKRYLPANLYNCKVDSRNKATYGKVKPLLDNIVEEVDGGLNVFFYGSNTGTGKTYYAAMFINHYIYKTCGTRFDFEHPLAMYVDYAKLIDDLRYLEDDTGIQERFDTIMNVPILLLDDLGAGTMSDYSREQTFLLLNHRFNNVLSTITTSNLSLRDLMQDKKLGKRNVSRLLSNGMAVEVGGTDRRADELRI